ncbi:superfamily II DNA or RNA helicase [Catenulispora sp. GP43]|uniref:DEAD/DEAH box helicase n=1 Tax=Catenulispora sp. GP43 TaxID=3156263 RepID=UPI003516FED1
MKDQERSAERAKGAEAAMGTAIPGLWPHQRQAIDAASSWLRDGGRFTVVAACGTGKTDIGVGAARELAAGRVLVVVPTLGLLEQTVAAYAHRSGGDLGSIVAVCSEASATMRRTITFGGMTGAVTTDSAELLRICGTERRCTVFTTYVSMATTVAQAHHEGLPPWDLIVVDEAHRTAGMSGRPWSAVLDDQRIPSVRRLYLTATPRVITGADADRHTIASMDDRQLYGPAGFELRFAEAIELGLLADYRVVVAVVNDSDIRDLMTTDRPGGDVPPSELATLAAQVALLRAARRFGLRRVITFHNRVARADRFAAGLAHTASAVGVDPGGLWAGHVSGSHSVSRRAEVLDRLHGEDERLVVVANAKVLAEGIDVPAVDGVVFADPRGSTVDAIQAVGRALRRGGNERKTATIVVPVLIAPGQDADLAGSGSAYAGVWEILRALRAHDQRAAVDLDLLYDHSRQLVTGQDPPPPPWLAIDGADWPEGFVKALTIATVDLDGPVLEAQWQRYLAAAAAYRQAHGHLRIPQGFIGPDGLAVGSWIRTQRHHRRRLAPHRVAALEALGMIWDPHAEQWAAGLRAAQAYAAEHGHLHPKAGYRNADGFGLGVWLNNLRARAITLSDEQRDALEALDPEWNPPWDRHWHRGLCRARAFHDRHGHLDVPLTWADSAGYQLGRWVSVQRNRASELSDEQRRALDALGMGWELAAARDRWWQQGLKSAAAFRDRHGHLQVPVQYETEDGTKLGLWLHNLRRRYRTGTLDPERIATLEALDIQWRPPRGPRPSHR